MNLPLYTSTTDLTRPNVVGLQHPNLAGLPTQLVCPIRENLALTPLRTRFQWGGIEFVVACDLLRPIHSSALKRIGELGESDSSEIIKTFKLLLAG
jgi:hypothetical protein